MTRYVVIYRDPHGTHHSLPFRNRDAARRWAHTQYREGRIERRYTIDTVS